MASEAWDTRSVGPAHDVLAPDGSEIRLLPQLGRGSMVHCRLPAGQVTHAVWHRRVQELWFCYAGAGQLWRRDPNGAEEIVALRPGVAASIPCGVAFQFRADGPQALELVITTMPPWPGPDEAIPTDGPWPPHTPGLDSHPPVA